MFDPGKAVPDFGTENFAALGLLFWSRMRHVVPSGTGSDMPKLPAPSRRSATPPRLPADGQLICCDVSEEWTEIGRRYWRKAGIADRIDLRLAPAADTLAKLVAAGQTGGFDFAFIDADKENYDLYYEQCLKLVRPGGLIAIDNALWHGAVADPACNDVDTAAIRALNRKIRDDARVDMVLLPIGDGLLLARPPQL